MKKMFILIFNLRDNAISLLLREKKIQLLLNIYHK